MKILIFGSTGMVGQGVLRECLLDSQVEKVLVINRSTAGKQHAKLTEILQAEPTGINALASQLAQYDACFFCLGITSVGMSEAEYSRVTYDLAMNAAKVLAQANPGMIFNYVSGAGTDSSEKGSVMWARIKGKTENALLKLPFKAAYMFRPGFIQPMNGEVSKVSWYQWIYAATKPLFPIFRGIFPKLVTSTEQIGKAMIQVAKNGAPKKILDCPDINELAALGN